MGFAPNALSHIRHDLPISFIAGDKDPLNNGLAWLTPPLQNIEITALAFTASAMPRAIRCC
jgi:hypothetical protein